MYSQRNDFPQEFGKYAENNPSKIFSCIRMSVNTAPACIRAKNKIPQEIVQRVLVLCGGTANAMTTMARQKLAKYRPANSCAQFPPSLPTSVPASFPILHTSLALPPSVGRAQYLFTISHACMPACLPACILRRPGDSQRESGRFARIDSRETIRRKPLFWGRAKGAAKGSCREMVVQKGVFVESVSSLLP